MAKKVVGVRFDSYGKIYEFHTDLDLVAGDLVVCDNATGFTVGTVIGYKEGRSLARKWIVQKVDLVSHNARLEREKKAANVRAKMELRRKKLEEREVYMLLAKEDEVMRELLAEYDQLNGAGE